MCGENFKRHRPTIIGLKGRSTDKLTSWDVKATAEASKLYAQDPGIPSVVDLPKEHLRDSSGRTAGAERG